MSKDYSQKYFEAQENSNEFWLEYSQQYLDWHREPKIACSKKDESGDVEWFSDGILNVSYNCIDRHVENGFGEKVAYFFEKDDGSQEKITYNTLFENVSRCANLLLKNGVTKGDVVCIYMPTSPKAIYTMLACARIGALHTVVFAGFSEKALKDRIQDASCKMVVTQDFFYRGGKKVYLLDRVASIRGGCESLKTVVSVLTEETQVENVVDFDRAMLEVSHISEPVWVNAEHPLFILYTSGSTGKPKGVYHTTAGYLLWAALTHKESFDLKENDIFWSVADIGWITGHSYLVYGPLANATTSVLFDGIPTYPTPARHWEIIDRYGVTVYYSTPTVIRSLMRMGNEFLLTTSRETLRILGTVGEPINPEAWRWYNERVGKQNCHIVDTWWQTETGGHVMAPIPGAAVPKPGSAMLPYYGIEPVIVDESGSVIDNVNTPGTLLLKGEWPGKLRGLYNDNDRYNDVYKRPYPGYFYTGDSAYFDSEGCWWVTGRADDVLNIAGRLLGTAELESAIITHVDAVEAAVVAGPDEVKGQCVHAFVLLRDDAEIKDGLIQEIVDCVKKEVGSFAKLDNVHLVDTLPKTRSGKIMRRVLRKIVEEDFDNLGDLSTLADPESVQKLLQYWDRK